MTTHDAVTVATIVNYPPEASVEIVEGTIYLSRSGGFEIADMELLPDDGLRHELLDGVIVVSPSPARKHQRATLEIAVALRSAAPEDLEVLLAPFDVQVGPRTVVKPDVLVLPREDRDGPVPPPLLAVEVLSPSNRGYDLVTKRNLYQSAGVPSYWIIDPDEPSVTNRSPSSCRTKLPSHRPISSANPAPRPARATGFHSPRAVPPHAADPR